LDKWAAAAPWGRGWAESPGREEVRFDEHRRIDLVRVFNRVHIQSPPESSDIPSFAHPHTARVIGLGYGVGNFEATVALENVDGRRLRERTEPWLFSIGPGDASAALLVEQLDAWFTEAGAYYYVVRLAPGPAEFRIRFEVSSEPPSQIATPSPEP